MLKQQIQQQLQQRLSPQQIQLIRMLELTSLEVEERINQELEENPALEEGREEEEPFDAEATEGGNEESDLDLSLGDYMSEDDIPDYKLQEYDRRVERKESVPFSSGPLLQDLLLQQLGLRDLSALDQKIGEYIIGNLDDDGYLRRDLSAITDDLIFNAGEEVSEADVERLLSIIQDFDPVGIACRNLQECLLTQLEKKAPQDTTALSIRVLREYYEAFVRKHYDKIQRGLNVDEATLKAVLHEITSLNPKPGNSWSTPADRAMDQIIPDFIVESNNGELTLSMNQRDVPLLRVSREYAEMFQDYSASKANQTKEMKSAVQFVKQKLDAAQWFINAVRQRQETLQRTMTAIMLLQSEFFLTGEEDTLRPMILKDVAERTGYDISTVSRVSNSKYVQTNFGVYPLKYFFSESTHNEQGEEISTREVKRIMKETIAAEDKQKPITDDALALLLKQKGYLIARRTVAKYREQMGLPVARLRKEL